MKTTIRFLTQHFYPDSSSTGNLLTDLAIKLAEHGYDIEVCTSQPIDNIKNKAEKFEVYKGVKIQRIASARMNRNSRFGKAFNLGYYFFRVFLKELFSSHKKRNFLYFIVSNPPFLPLVGSLLTNLKKIDFIHLLYDIEPEEAISVGYLSDKRLYIKIWKWSNKFIFRKAAHTVVLSEQMVETVIEKMKIAKAAPLKFREITIIDNWADGNYLKPIEYDKNEFIRANNLQGKFIINYSGNHGAMQRFESIMAAANILKSDDLAFIFVGDGLKKKGMMAEKETNKLENVYFFPYQDKNKLPHVQAASHLSIVHLEKEIEGYAFPSKLYSILASGTPVLALCRLKSRLADIIRDAKCGYVCQHENVQDIVDAINDIKSNPEKIKLYGENSRKYFEEHYTLEKAFEKYEVVFRKFIKNDN
jgi:glycosyltransferase involved in cell wall biosynthesis